MCKTHIPIIAVFIAGFLALAACDSMQVIEPPTPPQKSMAVQTGTPEFAQARMQLDASLIPHSIDDIFVKLADRFEGFGGLYEDVDGHLVIVSKQPETMRTVQGELVAEFLTRTSAPERSQAVFLRKETRMQQATYSFTELAVYRNLIERNLGDNIPLVLTDVDERQNLVRLGFDETAKVSEDKIVLVLAKLGVPPEAVVCEHIPVPEAAIGKGTASELPTPIMRALHITDYVRPLAGGLQIDRNGRCTLGIPVWYRNPGNQTRGFVTGNVANVVGLAFLYQQEVKPDERTLSEADPR